eukprot:1160159-Pelagomonas_calceolata.AAC.4
MQSALKNPPTLYVLSQNVIIWIAPSTHLSGCQCPTIRNIVTERCNIASRMILKVVSEGS